MDKAEVITGVEQGTQQWRELRNGLVTGSRIGAVMGLSPFQSRKALMREMVKEHLGDYVNISSKAMQWGTDNEAHVRALMELEFGYDFSDQSMRKVKHLGYSPDGFDVRANVLLEVKCPYSLRKEEAPEFKSIAELKHYYAQVQLGMALTGAHQCLFVQWAPNGTLVETVKRDDGYIDQLLEGARQFIVDLLIVLADDTAVEALLKSHEKRVDHEWADAVTEYLEAKAEFDAGKARMDAAKEGLVELSEGKNTAGCGLTLTRVETAGRVNWKKVSESLMPDDFDTESYKGKPSVSYRINVEDSE